MRTVQINHLDGRPWIATAFFDPGPTWWWVEEQVCDEDECEPDDVDVTDDGVVTVRGEPRYRLEKC